MIDGVVIKDLVIHSDERGYFAEIIRKSEKKFDVEFAQLSYSMGFQGVSKAWHLHKKQTDWTCAIIGDIKFVMYDTRKEKKTFKQIIEVYMGETKGRKLIKIPPGVAHGYKIINGPAFVIYLTNREYDPTDELRIPHDDSTIGYDWVSGPAIK